MSERFLARNWLRLSSRIAMVFGLGALSVAGAKAEVVTVDRHEPVARIPQQSAKTFGETQVWREDGRIYMSDAAGGTRELLLGDTEAARRLDELLERNAVTASTPHAVQHRIILVGGGGEGFHWAPNRNRTPGSGSTAPASAEQRQERSGTSANPTTVNPPPAPNRGSVAGQG